MFNTKKIPPVLLLPTIMITNHKTIKIIKSESNFLSTSERIYVLDTKIKSINHYLVSWWVSTLSSTTEAATIGLRPTKILFGYLKFFAVNVVKSFFQF